VGLRKGWWGRRSQKRSPVAGTASHSTQLVQGSRSHSVTIEHERQKAKGQREMLNDLNAVQCQIGVLGKVHRWACRSELIPLPQPLLPLHAAGLALKLGLLTWQCMIQRGICNLDNGPCKAGPMDGVLPEEDAGLLLQVDVLGSSNQLPQAGLASRA
jgi:hypothetical protein